ncbi:hypothetical protein CIK05_10345 [Bdellovibrio sp. qaytius]|nr:hypothetical protein CIK05_10345 [Bdellovibrio sp. qaytius]
MDKFQLLFENAPHGMATLDTQGHILEWNLQATQIFGLRKDQCLNQPFNQTLLTQSALKTFKTVLENILNSHLAATTNHHLELMALRHDGTEFPLELTLTPIKAHGDFVIYATMRDLKEVRKETEQAELELHKANMFLNAVVENIPDMVFVKEAKELRFTRFNRAGLELLGFSQHDLIGKNDYDFFPRAEADFFTKMDRNVLDSKSMIDIPEEPIQTNFKGQRFLHTKKVPIYDENGNPAYLLGISEDITDRKLAEETQRNLWKEQQARLDAEKALQLRDDFISIAAHELRTPLTALSLQIQLLEKFETQINPNYAAKYSTLVTSSTEQLGRFEKLVENLLDVSRASAGMLILEKSTEDLSELVKQTLQDNQTRFLKANCTVNLSLAPSVIGSWDKFRIEQVIVNLISNAIKYGAGKPIEITTHIKNKKAVLTIRDHGIGINPEDQKRIFNRFERAVSLKKYGGLGLGLFISQQIIQAHDGEIRVQSTPLEGSTFTVELPV